MEEKLYFVENVGCDDCTRGLVRVSDDDFPKFKEFIENLNKNSTYGCMPTIIAFEISEEQIKEIVYDPNISYMSDEYVECRNIFYLDGKTYTFAKEDFRPYSVLKQVIGD